MFDIIICAYNNLELSKRCVDSVRRCTEVGMYRIIFVNDGSTDDTKIWASKESSKSDFINIELSQNAGYINAATEGLIQATIISENKNPYLFFLNNDVTILSYWTYDALKLLENLEIAAIGAYGFKEVADRKIWFVSGSRLIIKKKVIKEIGFYDKNFKFGYWEDVDLSWRMQLAGYRVSEFVLPSEHNRNSTFKFNPNRANYFNDNRNYLINKVKKYYEKH